MACLKLNFASSILKNLTRISNVIAEQKRGNHILHNKNLRNILNEISLKPHCGLRSLYPLILTRSVDHIFLLRTVRDYSTPVSDVKSPTGAESSVKTNISDNARVPEVSKALSTEGSQSKPISDVSQQTTEVSNAIDISALPPIPTVSEISNVVPGALGEPTLESLGLGGWSPPGMIQQLINFIHVNFDLPWWAAIVCVATAIRILILPITIKSLKNSINCQNNMPEYQRLQLNLIEARKRGDYFHAATCAQELTDFMRTKKIFGLDMMLLYFIQFPIFVSYYLGLKRMAAANIESFKTGGLWWFTDLSVPDQFYLLPVITAGTVWCIIHFNSQGNITPLKSDAAIDWIKIFKHGSFGFVFLFTMNFPAAVLCYWSSANFFVLIQSSILRIPAVEKYLNIPKRIKPPSDILTKKKPGLVEGFKSTMNNMKIAREIEERDRLNAIKFEKAGTVPIQRTFKYDPTKPRPIPDPTLIQKK